jgi:hypothetical protein
MVRKIRKNKGKAYDFMGKKNKKKQEERKTTQRGFSR